MGDDKPTTATLPIRPIGPIRPIRLSKYAAPNIPPAAR